MRNTIIYIGNFPYPSKSGVGNRVRQNILLLKSLGYKVCVIAPDEQVGEEMPLADTKKEIDGCDVYFLPTAKSIKQRIFYKKDLQRTQELIKNLNANQEVFAVFFTGTKFALFANGVVNFCKKQGIKTVADSMDWLAIHSHSFLFNVIKRFDIAFEMRVVNRKADGVLAISTYLRDYYKKYVKNTIVIPPLFEKNIKNSMERDESKVIRLVYAGTPFGPNVVCKKPEALKDRLDKTIEYLYKIKTHGIENFVFDIYGVTEEGYCTAFPWHKGYVDFLGKNVCFHGRVQYSVIEEALGKADFTLLLRDQNRETRAGFPSKVGESITSGTPVIISDVGDHSLYIQSNTNGFLIHSDDENRAIEELKGIFSLDWTTILQIKKNCRQDEQFVYATYAQQMKTFLEDLSK